MERRDMEALIAVARERFFDDTEATPVHAPPTKGTKT